MLATMEEMRSDIENGRYGMIIGDDASGRVPTLLMKEIISSLYKRFGYKTPETKFLALYPTESRDDAWYSLDPKIDFFGTIAEVENRKIELAKQKIDLEFTSKINKNSLGDKKILLVTDTIATGGSLKPLIESLTENGFNVDVLTLESVPSRTTPTLLRGASVSRFYDLDVEGIYKKEKLAGVKKDSKTYQLKSLPLRKTQALTDLEKKGVQQKINLARKDIKILSDRVVDGFLSGRVAKERRELADELLDL